MSIKASCFLGRTAELARLVEVGESVVRGDRRVVLIGGEAGVGKSRTVAQLTSVLRDCRCHVIVGGCVEFGEQIWPFAALRELLACLVDDLEQERLDVVLGGAGVLLRHLVPELGATNELSASIDSNRLCEAVIGMLRRLAQWGPVVVVVEDLHWADESTRALFSLLARSSHPRSLLLVGTYRTEELVPSSPLASVLADVVRSARPDVIELERFDRPTTANLVQALRPDTFGDAEIDEIHRLSGGNAFYIEELVATANGRLGPSWSLRNVILSRTGTLSPEAGEVLSLIAVAGRLNLPVLARAMGVDDDAPSSAVDELVGAGLLVIDGVELRFRHELARTVILEQLVVHRRTSLHACLAGALETKRPDRLGEIAWHWTAAGKLDSALVAWIASGRTAMKQGMPREALAHFRQALDLWACVSEPEALADSDHAGLLLDAASAAYQGRQLTDALQLATRAAEELAGCDPWREGDAWLRLRNMYRFSYRWDECAAAAERALASIPESPPSSARGEALLYAAMGHIYAGRGAQAGRFAEEALDLACQLDNRDANVLARYAMCSVMAICGEDADALVRYASETVAICDETVSPEHRLLAFNSLTNSMARASRLSELIDIAAAGVELVQATGVGGPLGPIMAMYWTGCLVSLGRWDEAERVYEEHRELIEQADDRDVSLYMQMALIRQGRLDEARTQMERLRGLLDEPDYWTEDLGGLAALLLEFDVADGKVVDVVPFVGDILRRSVGMVSGEEWPLVAVAVAVLADQVVTSEGDVSVRDATTRWFKEAEAKTGPLEGEGRLVRDCAHAELSRLDGRAEPELWSDLADGYQQLGFRYEEAYARFRQAEALLAGVPGRSAAAHRQSLGVLRRAHTLAEQLPAPPLLRRIQLLARRARLQLESVIPEDEPRSHLDCLGLTSRESDVLQLVAAGLSNGAIGEQLFVSRKTASVHVSNILRKLGVDNRIEAAGVLHRMRLDGGDPVPANSRESLIP